MYLFCSGQYGVIDGPCQQTGMLLPLLPIGQWAVRWVVLFHGPVQIVSKQRWCNYSAFTWVFLEMESLNSKERREERIMESWVRKWKYHHVFYIKRVSCQTLIFSSWESPWGLLIELGSPWAKLGKPKNEPAYEGSTIRLAQPHA